MPAFTFEKILPPARRTPTEPNEPVIVARKHRGVIVQMLDRFAEARVKRNLSSGRAGSVRRDLRSQD